MSVHVGEVSVFNCKCVSGCLWLFVYECVCIGVLLYQCMCVCRCEYGVCESVHVCDDFAKYEL